MNKYLMYPGCSMESSAKAYMESINSIVEPLELDFEEIDDWNCCGATEYLGINLIPAYSLIARNLALAAKQMNGTRTVTAPCSACYLNLRRYTQSRLTPEIQARKLYWEARRSLQRSGSSGQHFVDFFRHLACSA